MYRVIAHDDHGEGFTDTIRFNGDHIIYKGHFPGHPVTPGVVQLQIVHELLEYHLEMGLKLLRMPQCKFLKILDPEQTPELRIHVDYRREGEEFLVKAQGENHDEVYFKFNAFYRQGLAQESGFVKSGE